MRDMRCIIRQRIPNNRENEKNTKQNDIQLLNQRPMPRVGRSIDRTRCMKNATVHVEPELDDEFLSRAVRQEQNHTTSIKPDDTLPLHVQDRCESSRTSRNTHIRSTGQNTSRQKEGAQSALAQLCFPSEVPLSI